MNHEYTPTKPFTLRPGLYLQNGTPMHEGKPFFGIGANYFGALLNTWETPEDGELTRVLDQLIDHDIRYIRVCFGPFWPIHVRDMIADPARFLAAADRVVEEAEKRGMGIIPSFFWNAQGISDYFGEPTRAWLEPRSLTRKYAKEAIRKIVTRYKESPAIWMWEFGNELNLSVDLPNRADLRAEAKPPLQVGCRIVRTAEDDLLDDDATELFTFFAKEVEKFDVYHRMITSGNAFPRPTQYQQRAFDLWPSRPDTREEMAQTLIWHNPDPMSCISIHVYGMEKHFEEMKTHDDLMRITMEECDKQGKALFVGEFAGLDKDCSFAIIDAIVKHRVPLSAVWAIGRVEWTLDQKPEIRDEVLARIKEANGILAGEE